MSEQLNRPHHTKRREAITEIIKSVALEEAALAHILDAEGEKIEKVLTFHGCNKQDLLDVNESVIEMVKAITELEKELEKKLSDFRECLCRCDHHDCDD